MKKTIFSMSSKLGKLFSMMIGLVFLLTLAASDLAAQKFVDPNSATIILKAEALNLEYDRMGLDPSSNPAEWEEISNKITYFSTIADMIMQSISVENSIFDGYANSIGGLPGLVSLTSADVYYQIFKNPNYQSGAIAPSTGVGTTTALNNLYISAAIDLLKR